MADIITSEIEIQSGVVSSGLSVGPNGGVTVLSGATVTDASAFEYGYFWVEDGGLVHDISLHDSGDVFLDGGRAENLTMETGGQADIMGGALQTGTVRNGGVGVIYTGATGSDVTVSDGGRFLVNGGKADSTLVSSGGSFVVQLSGGLAEHTTVFADGHVRVASGGGMSGTTLNGGRLDVIAGTVKDTMLNDGALHISFGGEGSAFAAGYAEDTVMNGGVFIISGGATVKNTTVNKGLFTVSSEVTADGATVNAGGGMLVLNGGTAAGIVENGGYVELEDGSDAVFASHTFSGLILNGSLSATVHSGTTARFTTLADDAILRIYSGGEAYDTVLNGGTLFATSATVGTITVNGGLATFESTAVSDLRLFGGTVFADSATVVTGAALNGGLFHVQSGTTVIGAEFNGAEIVADPGAIFSGTVLKTGCLEVASGMTEDLVIKGGTLTGIGGSFYSIKVDAGIADFAGSIVFGLTVNGGTVFADSAAIITGAVLNSGGVLSVQSGTLVTGAEFRGGTVQMEPGAIFSSSIVRNGGDVTAQAGEIYRTVAIDQMAKMYVQSGASVSTVVAVKDAELIVQSEGVVSGADVVGGVVTLTGGTALDVSLGKTTFPFSKGYFNTSSVISYGNAQLVAGSSAALHISSGGLAVGVYASEGNARFGSENVGIYVGDGGTVSNATIDTAVLYVSSGGVARDVRISGYAESLIGGYVLTQYPHHGKIYVLSGGYAENIDMNQAILNISGGTVRNLVASDWSVINFSGGVIGGALELTGSAKMTVESGGIIDFDISATAPGAAAVKKGLSLIEGAPVYTLTVSGTQEKGIYHLAADSPSFAGAFTVRNTDLTPLGTLTVGGSVLIGDLYYTVKVRNVNLDLIISAEAPPLEDPAAVYVDSEWSDVPFGGIVELADGGTATIGYDAFADGDEAVASVKPGGVVYITGGAVSFADVIAWNVVVRNGATVIDAAVAYDAALTLESGAHAVGITVSGESSLTLKSGSVCRDLNFLDQAATITVESGATISGACYFAKSYQGITIDGTIEFDISKPGTGTPLRGLSMFSGTPTCVITVDAASLKTGQYILASDMSYQFGQYSYTVRDIDGTVLGVIPAAFVVDNQMIYGTAEIGDFRYTISYKGGVGYGMGDAGSSVSLSVEKIYPDKESYVYLNASWKDKAVGESVIVTLLNGSTQTAVIGQNAFAVLDDAVNAVAEDGTIAISYTKPAQSLVVGGITATVISISGSGGITFSEETASGAGDSQMKDEMIYSFPEGLPRNIDLIGVGAKIENALVQATLSISNAIASDLSVVEGGGIVAVSGATCIGVDVAAGGSFLCRSAANLIRDLRVVSGGTFGMYTDTYPALGTSSGLTGTGVFESGADITINGTVNFDISGSTAGGVLFDGLKYVKGNTSYEITVGAQQESGLYHLAVNANGIADGVTLYVGGKNYFNNAGKLMPDQLVWIADRGFLLTFADGALDLMVIAFEPQSEVYLNAAWSGLEQYSVVEVSGGTAVLGIDAFAELMPALSACAEDGTLLIEGGTYTLSGTVEKTLSVRNGTLFADELILPQDLTLDAGSVLIGGLTVSESYQQSQSSGSIVCFGSVRLNEGATAAGTIVVNSRYGIVLDNADLTGTITVNTGGILSGRETFTDGMDITVNGYIDFDISGSTAGAEPLMRGLSRIKGSPTYTVTVNAQQEAGTYWLADDAAGFNGSITVRKENGAVLGTLKAGKSVQINGTYYTVRGTTSEGRMQLYLLVGEQIPPETVYLSTDWRWTGDGSVVSVPGGTANIGYDAFYSADDAVAAAQPGSSTIKIIRGMYSFSSGLDVPGDVVVNGGTLSVSAGDSRILGSIEINQSSLLILEEGAALEGAFTVNSGGSLTLKNGMAVSDLAFSNWGTLRLSNGSSASSIYLTQNGCIDVDGGGSASGIALAAESNQGSLTVNADGTASDIAVLGGYCFVNEGGTVSDVKVQGGRLNIESGSTVSNLTYQNGYLSVKGTLTGRCSFLTGNGVSFSDGGTLNFDISGSPAGGPTLVDGLSFIKGTPNYTLTVSATQREGIYVLASGAAMFAGVITVVNKAGDMLGTLMAGGRLAVDKAVYNLILTEESFLMLSVSAPDLTPPEIVSVTASTEALTNHDVTLTVTVVDDGDLDAVFYRFGEDGEWQVYDLANGLTVTQNGVVYFKAVDIVGNESEIVGHTVGNIDKTPPTTPGSPRAGVSGSMAALNWNASWDESGIDEYIVTYRLGEQEYTISTKSTDLVLENLSAGTWTWSVRSIDIVGNLSEVANGGSFTVTGEVVPEDEKRFFVGDFAGSGRPVIAKVSGGVVAIPGENGGLWGSLALEDGWSVAGVGDFDGDGRDDILRINAAGYVVGETSNGDGSFTAQVLNFKGAGWDILGVGDFDGDGRDDVLVANPTGASDTVGLLGYWKGGTEWMLVNGYSATWEMVSTGDFDGDGKCDMLWRNSFEGEDGLTYNAFCTWIIDPAEGESDWRMVSVAAPDEWNFLCSGDFDGDGTADIAMINMEGVVGIWGVKNGWLDSWSILSAVDTTAWTLVGVGDFDGDGTDDIAWRNPEAGIAGCWQIEDKQLASWQPLAILS